MKIRDLLSGTHRWTQRAYARNGRNAHVNVDSPNAVCHCLTGALRLCYPDRYSTERIMVRSAIIKAIGGGSITEWNDDPARTFSHIKGLVELLDI